MRSVLHPSAELVTSPKRVLMPESGLVVFESRHAPGFFGELKDEYAKFHLVISGRARWESCGRAYSVGPDTLFHIAAGVPHRQRDLSGEPVTLYAIHYRPELLAPSLSRELSRLGMLPLDLSSAHIDQARPVRALFQEMLFEQGECVFGWKMLLGARLTELAVSTLRLAQRLAGPARPGRVQASDSATRVAGYALRLRTQFYRPETLEEAARSVNLSRRQFTKVFRNVAGKTWRRYVQDLRLGHARKLLAQTEKSVTAVAFECGFEDLSHFHHLFKSETGCTPLVFRAHSGPTPRD
jgi:AraC-like DNA-binding protein